MKEIYYKYGNEGSLSSLNYLVKYFPKYKHYWKLWLESQDTYTKTVPIKRRFLRRKYIVSKLNYSFQADIAVMKSIFGIQLSKYNKNITYLLVIIDMLSRYCYVYPLISKSSLEVSKKIEIFLQNNEHKSVHFMTDKGGEFYGKYGWRCGVGKGESAWLATLNKCGRCCKRNFGTV